MEQQGERVFLAVAEHQSISDAAKALHFTQPTVSNYLAQLEKKLGVKLFFRKKGVRTITLTKEGEEFLPLAQRVVKAGDEVEHYIARHRKKVFRIAASTGGHKYIVHDVVQKLKQKQPELEILLVTGEARDIPLLVEGHGFDAALLYSQPPVDPFYSSRVIFYEERCILCPAQTPLPERTVSVKELDPAYEVQFGKYTISKESIARWREENFAYTGEPFFRTNGLSISPLYMSDPRCWTLMQVDMASALVAQQPDMLTMRHVEPAPPRLVCNLVLAEDYSNKPVIRDFLASCDEYIAERPYLQRPEELGREE